MSTIRLSGMIKLFFGLIFVGVMAAAICSDNVIYTSFAAEDIKQIQNRLILGKGEMYKLDKNNSAKYFSDNTDVVSVSENGIINAKTTGKVRIQVFTENTKEIYDTEVRNEPQSVSLDKNTVNVGVGEKISLNAILPEKSASGKIVFDSENKDIVKLTKDNDKGEFIAVGAGTAKLSVQLYNGKTASCTVNVTDAPEIIWFDKKYLDLGVGECESLNVLFEEGAGGSFSFSTDKDEIVEIENNEGNTVIKAVKEGELFITAKTYNGVEDKCRIRVRKKPDTVQLSKKEIKLKIGEIAILRAKLPENTSSSYLSFRTSGEGVVKLNQSNGTARLEGIGEGTVFVTVRTFNGIERSCRVTVTKGPVVEVIDGVTYMDGVLIVNKTYPLPENYGKGLDKTAENAFNKMADDAAKDNISLRIVSGFRSYDVQASLYESYCYERGREAADTFSARPGHSEHQSGLAMDINSVYDSFAFTDEAKWMEKNCHKYGFIIRYPKDKEAITGYKYESWHIRYIGKELAKKLYNRGITLEEYFDITSEYERK